MPDELKQALCERSADLNYLSNARAVAAQLCGPQGPFGSAEALNTEVGAHCLRELAVVAPEEVIEALERCFGNWSEEKLREEFGPGRRWTVWALDLLVWDSATFEPAMRFLFRLAVGENETWGNNATNEFAQRFRIQLPGTATSLEFRAGVLEALVAASEPQQLIVLLKALKSLLNSRMSSRMVGSEHQGSRKPYVDYNPLWNEVWPYINRGLEMWRTLARRHPDQIGIIRKELASTVTGLLVAAPAIGELEATIDELNPEGGVWAEMLSSISHVLRYELADAEDKVVAPIRALFEKLSPSTLAERLIFFVKDVDWGFEDPDEDDERDFEAPVRRAEALGRECASDLQTFVEVLPALSVGEFKHSFAFAKALLSAATERTDFIAAAVEELSKVKENADPSVVAGFISAIAADSGASAEELVKKLAGKAELRKFTPYFAGVALTPTLVELLSSLVRAAELEPRSLSILAGGRVMEALPPEAVQQLLEALRERDVSGALVALDLLSMYVHGREDKKVAMLGCASELLQVPGLLHAENIPTMGEHHIEVLASSVLNSPELGPKLAEFLTGELLVVSETREYRSDRLQTKIAANLVERFPDIFVSRLAPAIERGPASATWRLEHLLGSPFGKSEGEVNSFFSLGVARLRAVCQQYPKRFALFVARTAPLFTSETGNRDWTDIATILFDELGRRKDVLSEIGANLHTGIWAGPTSEYLNGFLPPLKKLLDHPVLDVRRWAKREISSIEKRIQSEIRDEEEWNLRRG